MAKKSALPCFNIDSATNGVFILLTAIIGIFTTDLVSLAKSEKRAVAA